jgi:hypothetical protein
MYLYFIIFMYAPPPPPRSSPEGGGRREREKEKNGREGERRATERIIFSGLEMCKNTKKGLSSGYIGRKRVVRECVRA